MTKVAARGRVLALDGDLCFQNVVIAELEPAFEVLSCRNVPEALTVLGLPGEVRAVVADLHLGSGPGGINLLSYVRSLMPGCRRILLSGAADAGEVQTALDRGIAHVFIRKPWERGALLAAVGIRAGYE